MKIKPVTACAVAAMTSWLCAAPNTAQACSTDPYVGAICVMALRNCDPQYYLPADGRSIAIADYPDYNKLVGSLYGSVDAAHVNLPDLRGVMATAAGTSASQPQANQKLAVRTGSLYQLLGLQNLPAHTHATLVETNLLNSSITGQISVSAAGTPGSSAGFTAQTPYLSGGQDQNNAPVHFWQSSLGQSVKLAGVTAQVTGTPGLGQITNAMTGLGQAFQTLPPQIGLTHCVAVKGQVY